MPKWSPVVENLVDRMFKVGAIVIRDVANGEEPFVYSSGNRGPGYVMVKGLVTQPDLLDGLVYQTAVKILETFPNVEYVGANVSGGMVPGHIVADALSKLTGRRIYYFYVRETRKVGGHGEQIVGDTLNDFFSTPRYGIVFEELVNFAQTTINSAVVQRKKGHVVDYGGTILSYDHSAQRESLAKAGMKIIALLLLPDVLDFAEGKYPRRLVDDYRALLANPAQWQLDHGYELPKKEGQ